jgi:hypothetical protein
MTYGRVLFADYKNNVQGAVVSHSAELVRGDFPSSAKRPPHSPVVSKTRLRHDGHLLPEGRRTHRPFRGHSYRIEVLPASLRSA